MDFKKKNIIAAIMVAMFLGAVEGTVVTTAMPTIVRDLNGFDKISFVFSIYLLTSAISTPIYGKLADLYGRKNTLTIGITIFLVGSALCGLSQNMNELIFLRGLQGLGAGSIFTVTYTIIGDVFPVSERTKVQGWIGSVWGIASIIGPFIGGFFIQFFTWHWIFYINIPFGILSIVLLQKNLKEDFKSKKQKADYAGIVLLSLSIIIFLYSILSIDENTNIFSMKFALSMLTVIVLIVLFCFTEKRAKDPLIPFEIFNGEINITNVISFLICAVLIGTDVYLPIYIQNILGYNAIISGISLASMSISWILSSFILSKLIPKHGEKIVALGASAIIILGTSLMYTLNEKSPLVLLIFYAFILGFGYGGILTITTILVQESVSYSKRGVATAANSLIKTIGQTVGAGVFGVIFNFSIVKHLNKMGIYNVRANNIYSTQNVKINLSSDIVKFSLNGGFHSILLVFIILALMSFIFSIILKDTLKKQKN
ncbi:MAG: MDR family MFS transporter [Clostridium sp.]|nr:MDR family MFS transporter [Clostridium sp.]